jgi:hypothetical protein
MDDLCSDGTIDRPGGMTFSVNNYPLKEAQGNVNVPVGSIVRAYPSNNGPYYIFKFAAPATTGGMEIIRIFAGMVDPFSIDGTNYVTDPAGCNAVFYLGTLMQYGGGCLTDECTDATIESCNLAWLAPLYQPAFLGIGTFQAALVPGFPYMAKYMGEDRTLTINTNDAPGPDPTNVQTITAPVYITAAMPFTMTCDGHTPTTIVGPY